MEALRWERRPTLERPLFVVAFEGWNDAGDAASLAVTYLAQAWDAERFASIDPEEFYDFTETRPQVRMIDGETRELEWPEVELLAATIPAGADGASRDVILVRGVEPQLRWRTFCGLLVEVARSYDAEMALILGALLADVPHTRPVRVSGSADDAALAARLGLLQSTYEGPTGIVGVLHHAFTEAGIPAASFWAAVPHYVHQVPSPKAALALVERSASLIGASVNPLELRVAAEEYVRQVSERVADDDDAAAYVAQLEEAADSERDPLELLGDPDRLAEEVERFLRRHRDG
ncbi:MAG TPA: PAC2 family protein [Acidimicrobiales bacterium]|nr:PAC2 family protein [Acidimicrobiales bacterium]